MPEIAPEALLSLVRRGGPLSLSISGFEARPQQQSMLRDVLQAYNKDQIALIEAGTGTGKSMAYLLPALLWAAQHQERTVISTHTINLQEQILYKDIPLLLEALKLDLKAVLVKGMSNYVCLRKLADTTLDSVEPREWEDLQRIRAWAQETRDGSRSSLSFVPRREIWELVCAEADACSFQRCPFYSRCHFIKARRQAEEAQILVANHHLLCVDIAERAVEQDYESTGVLPPYKHLILDEAHHFESVATEHFASRVSQYNILRTLHRLSHEKQGCLAFLEMQLSELSSLDISPSIKHKCSVDIPGMRRELFTALAKAFQAFENYLQIKRLKNELNTLRIRPEYQKEPFWQTTIIPHVKQLQEAISQFVITIVGIIKDLEKCEKSKKTEKLHSVLLDINALVNRLSKIELDLNCFMQEPKPQQVRWIESQAVRKASNLLLVNAELDISKQLSTALFTKLSSVILCSATLTTRGSFDFVKKQLGLTGEHAPDRTLIEQIYGSPFDYPKQLLLGVPKDMPEPEQPGYTQAVVDQVLQLLRISRGNAFILFTSYQMLNLCYEKISQKLNEEKFHLLKQGEDNRQALLRRFREMDRSVLFGTDSFWEGVDVAGEALRCVIIVKLPFKVPSEPMMEARTEAILAEKRDPFQEYSLPLAIVKFRQGFGRLIRSKKDHGCVVCLDQRLLSRPYGQQFLQSLPSCQQVFAESSILHQEMRKFYHRC